MGVWGMEILFNLHNNFWYRFISLPFVFFYYHFLIPILPYSHTPQMSSLTSVTLPVIAAAAAVSGLVRNVRAFGP